MSDIVQVEVNEAGDILIAPGDRKRLRLIPGMKLTVEDSENGGVRLHPESEQAVLVEKDGLLVVRAKATADLTEAIELERERQSQLR